MAESQQFLNGVWRLYFSKGFMARCEPLHASLLGDHHHIVPWEGMIWWWLPLLQPIGALLLSSFWEAEWKVVLVGPARRRNVSRLTIAMTGLQRVLNIFGHLIEVLCLCLCCGVGIYLFIYLFLEILLLRILMQGLMKYFVLQEWLSCNKGRVAFCATLKHTLSNGW